MAAVGNLQPAGRILPAKQNHPARVPFANWRNCMVLIVVLYFMDLSSLQLFVVHTYEKPYCARDAPHVVFRAFVMKCENQEFN